MRHSILQISQCWQFEINQHWWTEFNWALPQEPSWGVLKSEMFCRMDQESPTKDRKSIKDLNKTYQHNNIQRSGNSVNNKTFHNNNSSATTHCNSVSPNTSNRKATSWKKATEKTT